MSETHGFELVREEEIAEWKSIARLYRHIKTGAQLISVINDDENKAFAVSFSTPPSDSAGVAHILEHSVLCGSRKYPLKEPFIELVKGSLNTFLNAMTGAAETYYPVASTNERDFYNLVDVYLGAVFFPSLTPQVLQQEGRHYELAKKDDPLIYKGVVFNEMKGAYQMPNTILFNYAGRSLFPNHVYGVSSGGDPTKIPDLTFEQLSSFHRTYYHPSNALIWFWGDSDPEERLRLTDSYLREFERRDVDSSIPVAPPFSAPKRLTQPFAAGASEDSQKLMLSLNWVLTDKIDVELDNALEMLSYLLIGTPASALRKALVDSGLVEQVMGGIRDLRQRSFVIGLKGIAAGKAEAVENLALETLRALAENGIPKEAVEAAYNAHEFQLRERNSGGFPRGLSLGFSALSSWFYGADPFAPLQFEQPLARLRARMESGGFFEGMIRRLMLENNHRTTVVYEPDPGLTRREADAERERLEEIQQKLPESDLERIVAETLLLQQKQQTPDSEEALATLPRLALSDLDREVKTVPTERVEFAGCRTYYHDLFTNGILYIDLGFDLHALPQELLPYLPLFGKALTQLGTDKQDFVQLTQRIDAVTGGVWHEIVVSNAHDAPTALARLFVRAKATPSHAADLVGILRDVLLSVRWDNKERFRQMVLEEKMALEASLSDAIAFVNRRLAARYSEAGWVNERIRGISYLEFIRALAGRVDMDWPGVLAALTRIQSLLIERGSLIINITADRADSDAFLPQLEELIAAIPEPDNSLHPWKRGGEHVPEAFTIPGQVGSVGKILTLPGSGRIKQGVVLVASKLLRTTWLWEKVRVEGGAYGGRCTYDHLSELFSFTSYRDPNLLSTLSIYDRAGEFLQNLALSDSELTRAIIGTVSEMDAYQLPDAKGFTATIRALVGDTDTRRQRRRDEVLGTTLADLRAFGDVLSEAARTGEVCIVSSEEKIEKLNKERPDWLKVTKLL